MAQQNNYTSDGKKGGILAGKLHTQGGIKAIVTDDGHPVELEAEEIIINRKSSKKHCSILSKINEDGGGVAIPCDKQTHESLIMKNGGMVDSDKIRKVMEEFKVGKLHTSSGKKVTSRKQALAIAFEEKRKANTGNIYLKSYGKALKYYQLKDFLLTTKEDNHKYWLRNLNGFSIQSLNGQLYGNDSTSGIFNATKISISELDKKAVYKGIDFTITDEGIVTFPSKQDKFNCTTTGYDSRLNKYGNEYNVNLQDAVDFAWHFDDVRKKYEIKETLQKYIQDIKSGEEKMIVGDNLFSVYIRKLSVQDYGSGGPVKEEIFRQVTIVADNTSEPLVYYVVDKRGDNFVIVAHDKFDLWRKSKSQEEMYEFYEDVAHPSEIRPVEKETFALGGPITTRNEHEKAVSDLHKAESLQEMMKKANAIIRSKKNVTQRLISEAGLTESQAERIQQPDFARRVGFATYQLTNNNATIKRLQERVKMLEGKLAGAEKGNQTYEFESDGGGTIEVNYQADRVQIMFNTGRVPAELYKKLRHNGYVYSPSNKAFQRKITPQAISNAKYLFKPTENKIIEQEQEQSPETGIASEEVIYPNSQNEADLDIDESYDVDKGRELKAIFEKYYPELKQKFGIKNYSMQGLNPIIVFYTGATGNIDLTRQAKPEGFSPSVINNLKGISEFLLAKLNKKNTIASRSEFMDNLHPLDMWKQFSDGRMYRKFIIPKNINSRELFDAGIKERVEELQDGEHWQVVLSVIDGSEADRVSNLYMEIYPNKSNSDYQKELKRQSDAGEIENEDNGISLYHLAKNIQKEKEVETPKAGSVGVGGDVYYRGAESNEFGKGDFGGIWLSKDEKVASQYGKIHKYTTTDKLNLIDTNSKEAREVEEYFSKRHPSLLEEVNQDGKFTELWMFPPNELIDILKEDGYDGYNNGSDTFVFNDKKLKAVEQSLKETPKEESRTELDIDQTYDAEKGIKLKQLFEQYYEKGLKDRFKIADRHSEGLNLHIKFNYGLKGDLDLSRNATPGNYNPPARADLENLSKFLLSALNMTHEQVLSFFHPQVPSLNIHREKEHREKLITVVNPSMDVFKGISHNYKNQYELNNAIESFLDAKGTSSTNYSSDERNFIRKYSGYGGLDRKGQEKAKGHNVKGESFEFYTPKEIIEKMWALAYKFGYDNGPMLEPSIGTGEFLQFAPANTRMVGYEINPYSAKICKILYPLADIKIAPFEQVFIKNNFTVKDKTDHLEKFDLVIGNPPYGDFSIVESRYMSGMGEKDFTKARNYVEYFIRRSLDLLNPGGLLIFIVGAQLKNGGNMFLDSGTTPVKEWLAEHCTLETAYRLPDSVFERTSVTADIIVLKKNN